ncbi:MAG: hypothetical protein PWP27_1538 [Clostridiales bacterium]|jgi:hypothetical protein|nr:hypothetical protein [Clostridiales bacterium]MDK2933728.1 hypothetical protein [Clostridiales bacterium]
MKLFKKKIGLYIWCAVKSSTRQEATHLIDLKRILLLNNYKGEAEDFLLFLINEKFDKTFNVNVEDYGFVVFYTLIIPKMQIETCFKVNYDNNTFLKYSKINGEFSSYKYIKTILKYMLTEYKKNQLIY